MQHLMVHGQKKIRDLPYKPRFKFNNKIWGLQIYSTIVPGFGTLLVAVYENFVDMSKYSASKKK